MWTEFKNFIARGNVIDLAVAVIIGAAFGKIVSSLVEGVLMPPIGRLLGKVDFSSLFYVLDQWEGNAGIAGRGQGKRRSGHCLRGVHQRRHQFRHHCIRRVPARQDGESGQTPEHDLSLGPDHQRMSLLPFDDSDQGHSVRSMHD